MKKFILLGLVFTTLGCTQTVTTVEPTTLTIYTYDSLAADYGLLPAIQSQFELDNQVSLNVVSFPDTGAMVNQLLAEQANPQADLVLGVDNIDLARFGDSNLFSNATAFDYGYVGFVYDSEAIQFDTPVSLETLAEAEAYQNKIIIEQPGLSSPGTQLLLWSQAVFGDDANEFWQAMDNQVLTVAPDWSTAYYSMFLNGEAPIVLSYLTSPAYHIDQEGTDRYKAVPISDGYFKQTEYVASVVGSDADIVNQAFIDYMVSQPVQDQIATTQWMFPISTTVALPAAYDQLIQPTTDQVLTISPAVVGTHYDAWLTQWNGIFGQ